MWISYPGIEDENRTVGTRTLLSSQCWCLWSRRFVLSTTLSSWRPSLFLYVSLSPHLSPPVSLSLSVRLSGCPSSGCLTSSVTSLSMPCSAAFLFRRWGRTAKKAGLSKRAAMVLLCHTDWTDRGFTTLACLRRLFRYTHKHTRTNIGIHTHTRYAL